MSKVRKVTLIGRNGQDLSGTVPVLQIELDQMVQHQPGVMVPEQVHQTGGYTPPTTALAANQYADIPRHFALQSESVAGEVECVKTTMSDGTVLFIKIAKTDWNASLADTAEYADITT